MNDKANQLLDAWMQLDDEWTKCMTQIEILRERAGNLAQKRDDAYRAWAEYTGKTI